VKVVLVPVGRGNWRALVLEVGGPAATDLFPAIREGQVKVGDRWTIAGREWRIVEVR